MGAPVAPRALAAAEAARGALAAHPRHLLLGALLAGLLAGPLGPAALLLAGTALAAVAAAARPAGGPAARAHRVPPSVLAAGAVAAVCAGGLVADARMAVLDRTALGPHLGREVTVRATLLEAPRERSFGARAALAQLADGAGRGERVLLRIPSYAGLPARGQGPPAGAAPPGARVGVRGRLVALPDREAHALRRGAHALLRVNALRLTGDRRGGLAGAMDRVRERAEAALAGGLPPALGALSRGMVLGQDDALPEELREDLRTAGLAHLVAASGTNVMLLSALVLAAGALLGLPLRARLGAALLVIAAYVPLAGAGPSIQRAAVMGGAGLVAALAGRPASRWYAVLLAAAGTLAWSPRSAGDPGWQLSFAAVLAILALGPALRARLHRRAVPRGLAEALALTVAATLGTAPLLALHFERVSLASLPANLLAVPAVAPIMWLGTLTAAAGQLAAVPAGPLAALAALAAPLAALTTLPLAFIAAVGETCAELPLAEIPVALPGPLSVAATYAALAALAVSRVARRGALAAALVGVALLAPGRGPGPPPGLRVSILDVGQGDATLVQHGPHAVLVDTGPPGAPLLARLREAGARRLDALVLTHPSADHDANAAAVLRELPVGVVLDGGALGGPLDAGSKSTPGLRAAAREAARRGVRRVAARAGQALRAGPLQLRVLSPPAGPSPRVDEPNPYATVLHVRDGGFDALLTADAESDATLPLELPRVELLKVAHHGSDDPGLPQLLERVRPHAAVIPVGPNAYGHPSPSTLAALRTVPQVRRTDRDGTVRVTVEGGRVVARGAG